MNRTFLLSVIVIGLLLFSACGTLNSERQEIISFTRQALEIEGKRNELMAYFSEPLPPLVPGQFSGANWLVNTFFLKGVPVNFSDRFPSGLEGMTSLTQKVLLLESPQPMQSIKASFIYIYTTEIELKEKDFTLVNPRVTKDNVKALIESFSKFQNLYFEDSPWVKLQLLRREVYIHWAEILQEHDIDPLEEGFTSLIEK